MKRKLMLSVLMLGTIITQAQTRGTNPDSTGRDQIKTVFGQSGSLGWWVAPDFSWTQLGGKDAFFGGMSGGIIVDHSFSLGVAGYGIIESQELKFAGIVDTAEVYLYGGYGGLRLEYRLRPMEMINFSFPLLIGGGGLAYSTWSDYEQHPYHEEDWEIEAWDSYFVIEPGVALGINLLKFMRLDTGVSYRFTSGLELPKMESDILNSFSVTASLKFGKF